MEATVSESNAPSKTLSQKLHFPAPTLRHIWFSIPLFFAAVRGFLAPFGLLDFYWHLKLGQVIVETHSIPQTDIFSFTAAGKAFVDQSWLADVLFYWIYKVGGLALVGFFNGILLFLVLLPLSFLCRKATELVWPSVISLLLVGFCFPWNLRPQIFSSLLFSFFCWILWSYRSKSSRAIYALPFLMVLWVNLHGAFMIGLVLIVIFLACESIEILAGRSRDTASIRRLKTLGLVFVLCLLATLANPEFFGVYDYVRTILSASSVQKYVSEWQPPAMNSSNGFIMFYLPFFLLTFLLICSKRRPGLPEIALYLAFGAYGMVSLRNCVWFQIVSAPMIAGYLPQVDWSVFHLNSVVVAAGRRVREGRKKGELPFLNRGILIAMLLVLVLQSPWIHLWLRKGTLQEAGTPIRAMDFIARNNLQGNIFHPQVYGDYLIWRLWPMQRSFFDGRVHLFDETFLRSYFRIFQDSAWEKLLQKYGIRYLLLPKDEKDHDAIKLIEAARSSGRWILRYEDSLSILFEKISEP
jgi:hypothetical protein